MLLQAWEARLNQGGQTCYARMSWKTMKSNIVSVEFTQKPSSYFVIHAGCRRIYKLAKSFLRT